jgi:hypothetical protein
MPQKLTVIRMNDSHAYLEPHAELFWHGSLEVYRSAGGFAHICMPSFPRFVQP